MKYKDIIELLAPHSEEDVVFTAADCENPYEECHEETIAFFSNGSTIFRVKQTYDNKSLEQIQHPTFKAL